MTLTAPVNAYDTTGADFKASVHRQIHADLGHLGKINKISGVITNTASGGPMVDDLTIFIENPRLRFLLQMNAALNQAGNGLIYTDVWDNSYTPVGNGGYGSNPVNEQAQAVVNKVFTRLDRHPALADWSLKHSLGVRLGLAPVGAFVVPSGAGVGLDLMLSIPGDLVSNLAFALGGLGAACAVVDVGVVNSRMRRINSAVDRWNQDRRSTLTESFASAAEESTFFDALQRGAAQHGITDVRKVAVTKREKVDWSPALSSSDVLSDKDREVAEQPYRTFMIEFTGTSHGFAQRKYLWDGKGFFINHGRNYVQSGVQRLIFVPVGLRDRKSEFGEDREIEPEEEQTASSRWRQRIADQKRMKGWRQRR